MFLLWQKKYNLQWVLHQLREVWTKDFKSSPSEEDDVEEDDVEMTGEDSGKVSRVFLTELVIRHVRNRFFFHPLLELIERLWFDICWCC